MQHQPQQMPPQPPRDPRGPGDDPDEPWGGYRPFVHREPWKTFGFLIFF